LKAEEKSWRNEMKQKKLGNAPEEEQKQKAEGSV
jgi:hypothetical protein